MNREFLVSILGTFKVKAESLQKKVNRIYLSISIIVIIIIIIIVIVIIITIIIIIIIIIIMIIIIIIIISVETDRRVEIVGHSPGLAIAIFISRK